MGWTFLFAEARGASGRVGIGNLRRERQLSRSLRLGHAVLPRELLDGLDAAEGKKVQKVVPVNAAVFDQFLSQRIQVIRADDLLVLLLAAPAYRPQTSDLRADGELDRPLAHRTGDFAGAQIFPALAGGRGGMGEESVGTMAIEPVVHG